MAAFEKIVYNIAEAVKREHDQPFLERLRFMIPYYRSTLLRRDEGKGRKLDQGFLQTLEEVSLEEIPLGLPEIPQTRCTLRSRFRVPKFVRLVSGPAIRTVTSINDARIVHPIAFEAVRSYTNGRFTGHEPRYYLRDGHIWVINAPALELVKVEAAFEDPFEAILFNDPQADLFEVDYPIPLDFVQAVTELILKSEGRPDDPTNDDVVVNE